MFSSDAAMLTFFIKPDKAADFEKVMAKLHQALANSDKPERKQQAAGWKLFKAAEPGPNGTVLYINFLSPALKGGDYTISKILAEVYPQEVQQLFPLYRDAFAGPEPRRAEADRRLQRARAAGSARTVSGPRATGFGSGQDQRGGRGQTLRPPRFISTCTSHFPFHLALRTSNFALLKGDIRADREPVRRPVHARRFPA